MSEKNKKTKEINYYKISTILLLLIILISFLSFFYIKSQDKTYLSGVVFGQQNAVNIILSEVNKEGFITFQTDLGNVTLVPLNTIETAREKAILNLVSIVEENGFVSISRGDRNLVLVPYQGN